MTPRLRWLCAILLSALLPATASAELYSGYSQKAAPWVGKRLDGKPCKGGSPDGGKIYDYLYRQNFAPTLSLVEENHFTRGVENLSKGKSSTPMGDIDFVLRIFPNHHRALRSAVEFSLKHKRYPASEHGLPAECYLSRAMKFSPSDPVPPSLLGYYMHRKGKLKQALKANEVAMRLSPSDVMTRYNTGLLLVELKRYDEARAIAEPLYDAGLDLPGLKNKLIRAGAWEQPAEPAAEVPQSSSPDVETVAAESGPAEN
jgi:tetratricopeptide (TPR) repeat protein